MLAEARVGFLPATQRLQGSRVGTAPENTARGRRTRPIEQVSGDLRRGEAAELAWGEHLPLMIADQRRLSPGKPSCEVGTDEAAPLSSKCLRGRSRRLAPIFDERGAAQRPAQVLAGQPNLAIVVDECNVTPVGLPSLAHYVQSELFQPAHDPSDPQDRYTYERLGGVLFLNTVSFGVDVEYNVEFVANPNVIAPVNYAERVLHFETLTADTDRREELRYAGSNGFFHACES